MWPQGSHKARDSLEQLQLTEIRLQYYLGKERRAEDDEMLVPGWLWSFSEYKRAAESLAAAVSLSAVRGNRYLWNLKIDGREDNLPPGIPWLLLAWPAEMKTRERPGEVCASCARHLVWEKRDQCSQRWALNEPEVIKTAGKVFIPSGRRKKKQGGRGRHSGSLFRSWAPGPALTFHSSQDQPSPFTPAEVSL